MRRLSFASYNIHRCIGVDGRHDPERVADVIRELDADVVALQEVDSRYHVEDGLDQIVYLAEATGYRPLAGPVLRTHSGNYGNGLLLRHEPRALRRIDLSVAGREPRGALDVEVESPDGPIRVVAVHFGLSARERAIQVSRILHAVGPRPAEPCAGQQVPLLASHPNTL